MKRQSPVVIVIRQRRALPSPVVVPADTDPPDEFLTINELCEWLRVSDKTIRDWRKRRGFPVIEIEGWIRFSRDDVRAWLSDQTQRSALREVA